MRAAFNVAVRVLSSLGLTCVLLILLGLLTFLGTLEQDEHGLFVVQKKYFESIVLVHDFGPLRVPLPGANLVLCVLAANLLVGGMIRIRKSWRTSGVLVVHAGIALLLLSGLVKFKFSEDGHVTLFEGDQASVFQSYYRWEIAIAERAGDGQLREHVIPQEQFRSATSTSPVRLTSPELPFALEVSGWMKNCQPMPKGPMFSVDVPVIDGVFLQELDIEKEAERNVAGAYVATVTPSGERQEGILWGLERDPWTVAVGGREFALGLRHERYPMPFTIRLDKFTKKDHPRLNLAAEFSSDVTLVEQGTPREVQISMNKPLRDEGLVVYQASWGPANARPGDPLFSTLAVVRNPADKYPEIACWIIGIGLVLHFSMKLFRYIQIEAKAS